MNGYITDSVARDHVDTLLAGAAASRRAKEARRARRARREAAKGETKANTANTARHGRAASVGHAAARPFVAVQTWIAAGQL